MTGGPPDAPHQAHRDGVHGSPRPDLASVLSKPAALWLSPRTRSTRPLAPDQLACSCRVCGTGAPTPNAAPLRDREHSPDGRAALACASTAMARLHGFGALAPLPRIVQSASVVRSDQALVASSVSGSASAQPRRVSKSTGGFMALIFPVRRAICLCSRRGPTAPERPPLTTAPPWRARRGAPDAPGALVRCSDSQAGGRAHHRRAGVRGWPARIRSVSIRCGWIGRAAAGYGRTWTLPARMRPSARTSPFRVRVKTSWCPLMLLSSR
jgi:hypothetical protein